ncbi:MAG: hypothetical protein ACRYGP_22550 [Janthinobacterium lividum]
MTDHRAKRAFRAAAVLALGLAAVGVPGSAQAQFFGGWGGWDNGGSWDGLAPQQVRRAITDRGFRVLAPLRRNGSVFVADVVDQRGRRERLIVAAADAQILQRFLVDDGSRPLPRGTDDGRGIASRGGDDGLIPPADIPDTGRRALRPLDRDQPAPRFGDADPGSDATDPAAPDGTPRRAAPPIRTVKPRPRIVERTPEPPAAGREPGPVETTPLAPAAPRVPAPVAKAPAPAPAVVASRPEPTTASIPAVAPAPAPVVAAPSAAPSSVAAAPAASAVASRRMTDPLAIPGGTDAAGKPVRSVASGITGTPAPAAAPARPGDVPVAPLD